MQQISHSFTHHTFDSVDSRLNETAGADIDETVARFAVALQIRTSGLDPDGSQDDPIQNDRSL